MRVLTGREVSKWPEYTALIQRLGIDLNGMTEVELTISIHDAVRYRINKIATTNEPQMPQDFVVSDSEKENVK